MAASFEISNLSAWYGNRLAIEDISASTRARRLHCFCTEPTTKRSSRRKRYNCVM